MANKLSVVAEWAIVNVLPVAGQETGLLKTAVRFVVKTFVQQSILDLELPANVDSVFEKVKNEGLQSIVQNVLSLLDQQLQNVDLNNLTGGQEVLTEAKWIFEDAWKAVTFVIAFHFIRRFPYNHNKYI